MLRHQATTAPAARKSEPLIALAALLIGATLLAYLPALRGGFIFDDNVFLTDNPLIHASDGLRRFWFSREPSDYWPVTSSTLWLEWRLWGMNAAGYHATNVALHVAGALLLWALLRRLRIPGAFVAALIFALHPLNVASVAWITQRKNLLAMLFYLASIWLAASGPASSWSLSKASSWPTPVRRSSQSEGGSRAADPAPILFYCLSLLSFALAILSKGSAIILPLVLLGIVVWHRRPEARDWRRLAPYFAIAAILGAVEARFSTVLGAGQMESLGTIGRLIRAGAVVWFYVGKILWPSNLCFDYGPWKIQTGDWRWWVPLAAAIAATAWLWRYRQRWSKPALFAWGYCCIALLPAMGFVEVGFMRYSPVANPYSHLALAGATALAGALWARAAAGTSGGRRTMMIAGAAAIAAVLGAATWRQNRIYADADRLYRDTLARNPSSWLAHNNLGVILSREGRLDPALAQLEEAVRLKPDFAEARNDLGIVLYQEGRSAEAITQYHEALRLRPGFYQARNNLGAALARSERLPEAIKEFRESLRIEPDYRDAQLNLARAEDLENRQGPVKK